jgi:class 3 adenylate cyclase
MDRHDPEPGVEITAAALADAHKRDVEIQANYGVRYISYWFDPQMQHVFCLVEAPNKDAAEAVHRDAHGLLASKIMEVDPGVVEQFLGGIEEAPVGEPRVASGLRTILVTDIEGSTELVQRLGDDVAIRIIREHEGIIGDCLRKANGRMVKGLGDGVLASFESIVRALDCTLDIQERFDERNESSDQPIRLRVGLSAGEPVSENDDLYGSAVTLAARICAACEPGGILASSAVRDLTIGKGFRWDGGGEVTLKGFEDPMRLYSLTGRSG